MNQPMVTEELIVTVRTRISIVEVIGERVSLEPRGKHHVGRCPFHADEASSLHVMGGRGGFFYCLGCNAAGNLISFVQLRERLGFPEAVRRLSQRLPPDAAPSEPLVATP